MQFDFSIFEDLQNTHILVLGLGREAQSTVTFFNHYLPGAITWSLADEKPLNQLSPFWKDMVSSEQASYYPASEITWQGINFVAVSPGISDQKMMVSYQKPDETPIITNTDLFFELAETVDDSLVTIGVTGTKGKSTTTAAIHHVLQELEVQTVLGGNIGVPPLDLIGDLKTNESKETEKTYAVLELSSHQLSRVTHSPDIAVVLAITPEHLDYYPTFADYLEAKRNIVRFQLEADTVFYNDESKTARETAALSTGNKHSFTSKTITFEHSKLKITGQHSVLNLTPAILIAQLLNFDQNQAIDKLYSFNGLPHRLQLVFEEKNVNSKDSIKYYNDSLATTPEATIAAVNSFQNPIVLIVGGYDRGLEYGALGRFLTKSAQNKKLRGVVYFPPSGDRIIKTIHSSSLPLIKVEGMAEAVAEAKRLAQPNDVILLSPASASFGQFKDYADRGNQFEKQAKAQSNKG